MKIKNTTVGWFVNTITLIAFIKISSVISNIGYCEIAVNYIIASKLYDKWKN